MLNISDNLKQKYTGDLLPPDIVLNIAGTTYTNKDFTSGSLKIKESLCSKDTLDLTSVEASSLKVTIANEDGNVTGLVGKRVSAKQDELDLGVYTITNAKLSTDYTTDIECYDDLKKFVDTDVSDWWNTQLVFPLSLKDLLIKLCERVGVLTELPNAWTNSDMQVTKTTYFQNLKASELLGYIQEASGTFFRMSRTGKLKAINPNKTPTEIPYTRLFNDATISDEETKAIEKLSIKSSEKDLGVSSGNEDGNTYLILANPLLFGLSTEQMKSISDKLFSAYKWQAYKPCKASYKSLPYLEVGDWVTVTTFKGSVATFPILSRELSDVNLLADTVEAKGKKEQKKTVSSAKQIQVLSWNVHEMENTIETLKSKIQNVGTTSDRVVSIEHFFLYNNGTKPDVNDSGWTKTPLGSVPVGQQMWEKIVTHFAVQADDVTIINLSDNSVISIEPEYFESLSVTEPLDDYIYPSADLLPSYTLYPVTKHNKGWQPEPYDRVGYCRLTRFKYTYKDGTIKYKDPIKDDQFNQAIYAFNQQSMYLQEKIETNTTNIEQTNKKIVLQAENIRHYQSKNAEDIIKLNTKIATTAEQIELEAKSYVKKDGLITQINSSYKQSAEKIDIQAINIDLSGYVTFNSLSEEGSTVINGSNIKTGTITAVDIFGSNIEGSSITFRNGDKYITATGNTDAFNNTHGILFKGNGDFTISANEFTISRTDDNGTGIYTWFHAAGDKARNDIQITGGITGHQESLRLGSDYFSIGDRNIGLYRDSGSKYVTLATVGGNGKLKFYYKDGIYYVIGVTDNEFQNR
jgi:hypothetical protein